MTAVSDTSPLCYLVLIGEIDLLPTLFDEILIPPAVAAELSDPGAPESVRHWWSAPPPWLRIGAPVAAQAPTGALRRLHPGEREAIVLATEVRAAVLLVDDKAARRAAKTLGLAVMGLLGVLSAAAEGGHVDLAAAIERLQATNFRVSPGLLRDLLAHHGQ